MKQRKSAKEKVHAFLKRKPRGWVFSAVDVPLDLPRFAIDQSLVALLADGVVARAVRGVYYKPRISQVLKAPVPPDVSSVAGAIARKFNWSLAPNEDAALNRHRLSTQVPAHCVFQSSGPNRKYKVGNRDLVFLHRCLRETDLRSQECVSVVRTFKALGREHATLDVARAIRVQYSSRQWETIWRESTGVSGWIRERIRMVMGEL